MAALPALDFRYPSASDVSVSINTTIIVDWTTDLDTTQWSDADERAAIFLLLKNATNEVVPVSYTSYTANIRRITLTPTSPLEYDTEYKVIIKKGVRDSYGRTSSDEYNWDFTTTTTSLDTPSLTYPSDKTIHQVFPTFRWTLVTSASGPVYYQFQLGTNPNFTTPLVNATSISTSSYVPGGSFSDDLTYYWRIRAYVSSATGVWTGINSFYFGDIADAHPTSKTTYVPPQAFLLSTIGFKNGLSNQGSFPTISLSFTTEPASNYTSFITFKEKSQLPRNDSSATYDEANVSGSWSLNVSSFTATFTPGGSISNNTRYTITVDEFLCDINSNSLGAEATYYFTGKYDPYYVDIRAVKARLRSESSTMPDDMINYYIYMASLEAKARYWGYLTQASDTSIDSLLETTVRDSSNLRSFGVLKWTEAVATFNVLKATLIDETRNIGRSRKLGDFSESLTKDFTDAIKKSLDLLESEIDEWEDYLIPSDSPITASPHSAWSPSSWDLDWSVNGIESRRDDTLNWGW